jgi:hypothetical protein
MRSNCGMCGGLIKLSTRTYPDHDVRPGLFQLLASCGDCGRTSTYDCVKPSPDKFIEKEPDEALYKKAVEGIHKRGLLDPQEYINRVKSGEIHTKEQEPDNVIPFTGITRHDVPVTTILDHLCRLDIMEIVAVGFLEDGSEFFSSSKADGAASLWHLTRAQHKLMTYADVEGEQS